MFPKGPRFQQLKIPDVPGPNAYNVPPDSLLDSHKRGAFLDSAIRFNSNNPQSELTPSSLPRDTDRYAALQRKVEELECVHIDDKRTHNAHFDRLKLDLARSQRTVQEQADRIAKQDKQINILESRATDFKKNASSSEATLKELRVKLKLAEHERTQASTKLSDIAQLNSKLRQGICEKDRRIAELDSLLANEKKKREAVEAKFSQLNKNVDGRAQAAAQHLESMFAQTQSEAEHVLALAQTQASCKQEALSAELCQCRELLSIITSQYSQLATSAVPSSTHKSLKLQYAASELRVARLERKLANSESQVVELAHLVRQTKDENSLLKQQYDDLHYEPSFSSSHDISLVTDTAQTTLHAIASDILESQNKMLDIDKHSSELFSNFYQLACDDLVSNCCRLEVNLEHAQALEKQRGRDLSSALASHEAIAAQLEFMQKERTYLQTELSAVNADRDALKASFAASEKEATELRLRLHDANNSHASALQREKSNIHQLTTTVQKSRMAEEALRAEIDQLTAELADAERYQEAYYSLSDEVDLLLSRNQLAEEEVKHLSKFNAKILGHQNPAQRIMYVDKIRQELADTKHALAVLSREKQSILSQNSNMQQELDMYTSVMVSTDTKPRTAITRVGRPPLVSLNGSLNSSSSTNSVSKTKPKPSIQAMDTINGDMTLDEIV